MSALKTHPLRQSLNDEAHARPSLTLPSPARLSSLAFFFQQDHGEQRAALIELTQLLALPTPEDGCMEYIGRNEQITVRWSQHTEFVRYTFCLESGAAEPFLSTAMDAVPEAWLASVPGALLVGVHAVLLDTRRAAPRDTLCERWFGHRDVIGSDIADGNAVALTDLRLHDDPRLGAGFSRLVVLNRNMGERQTGRMLARLFEIETYRMLALLALPIAKAQMHTLDTLGIGLKDITQRLRQGDTPDGVLLGELSDLAVQIEDVISASQYRFSAARAYSALVARRIEELREQRLSGVQPFREFMERRLAPAMATCDTVTGRQASLTARIQRATALLRTRVEIEQEQQNQKLLASMNRRAELQLHLQETVEGLSVGVLTYYAVGLLGYGFKALKAAGVHLNAELATGLAIVPVGLVVWAVVGRIKKTIGPH